MEVPNIQNYININNYPKLIIQLVISINMIEVSKINDP